MRWLLILSLLVACAHDHDHEEAGHDHEEAHHDHEEAGHDAEARERIPVPREVRQNLGIRFAAAERRVVERTLRLPGRFQPTTAAARAYHAPLEGTIELLVEPLQRVEVGQVIGRIESPALRDRQHELHTNLHEVREAEEEIAVLRAQIDGVQRQLALVKRRLKTLAGAQVRVAELEARRLELESQLPVLRARLAGARAEVHRERHHYESRLQALAFLVGVPMDQLTAPVEEGEEGLPWAALNEIVVRARRGGTVTQVAVTPGAWVEQGALIAEVVDPGDLRFVATALQSDLARLEDGQRARVVHPRHPTREIHGEVHLGVVGAEDRTFPVWIRLGSVPDWARPGLAAFAEVIVSSSGEPKVAIPSRALVRDGLRQIYFRRDPDDPDVVIRTVADPGVSDGRWTVVEAVEAGQEVVVEGVYELKLAGAARSRTGAHVHADGSVHRDHE